jgi:hypothetical protein
MEDSPIGRAASQEAAKSGDLLQRRRLMISPAADGGNR